MKYTVDGLLSAMDDKGYRVFRGEWNINLVGVRSAEQSANTFNDYICVLFQLLGRWELFAFAATTDPGLFYRQNPINPAGTAVLAPGQYRGCWKLGKHRGDYNALVQRKAMRVYRDNNRDAIVDTTGETESGLQGINLHRASIKGTSFEVGRWSAGCQVVRAPWDFDMLMAMCRRAALTYGDNFSYTLLTESELNGALSH
jgi:hypothetical protein